MSLNVVDHYSVHLKEVLFRYSLHSRYIGNRIKTVYMSNPAQTRVKAIDFRHREDIRYCAPAQKFPGSVTVQLQRNPPFLGSSTGMLLASAGH